MNSNFQIPQTFMPISLKLIMNNLDNIFPNNIGQLTQIIYYRNLASLKNEMEYHQINLNDQSFILDKISQMVADILNYLFCNQKYQQQSQKIQSNFVSFCMKSYLFQVRNDNALLSRTNSQSVEIFTEIKPISMLINSKDFKHFSKLMHLLTKITQNIKKEEFCTKREIYYEDPDLFENQQNLDAMLQSLCFQLQVPRRLLNIVSASQGLVAGNLSFIEGNYFYDLNDLSFVNQGQQIFQFVQKITDIHTEAQFILIVEKQTVFFQLMMEGVEKLMKKCILITGQGYPDYATKSFTKQIASHYPRLPIFFIGDYDPYGFDILTQYSFGNPLNSFEFDSLPQIFYLGIRLREIQELIRTNPKNISIIELNESERKKKQEILSRPYFQYLSDSYQQSSDILLNSGRDFIDVDQLQRDRWLQWKKQLLQMQFKIQIESISSNVDKFSHFVLNQIENENFL